MSSKTSKRRPLSDEALHLIAQRFAVLSSVTRLRLIHALFEGERHVISLTEATGGTQANTSRQLHMLTQAQIVSHRKEGLHVFYWIADPSIFKLCDLMCRSLERQLVKQADAFRSTDER